jgi:hypothetical protein
MLILLFLYLGVIALYEAYDNKAAAARACAVLALVGTVNIPIIYKSVDWWYSLHQPASIKFTGESTIDPSMLYPLLLCIVSFYALFTCALLANMRVAILDGSGARPGCSASPRGRLMYFDSLLSAAAAWTGTVPTCGRAYAITLLVLRS